MLKRYIIPLAATFFLVAEGAIAQPIGTPPTPRLPQFQLTSRLLDLLDDDTGEVRLQGVSGPRVVRAGERVAFTVVANLESAALPLKCQWNFGDGTTTFELVGVHTFTKPGKDRVICTLGNNVSEDIEAFDVYVLPPESSTSVRSVSTSDKKEFMRPETGL